MNFFNEDNFLNQFFPDFVIIISFSPNVNLYFLSDPI